MNDKILVVEDEISLQETLSYNLRHEGYQVEIAGDGVDGLRLAKEFHPDLVLLDVMLPRMDGFEVCKNLRADMDMPILMLTARADEIDRVVGLEIGADDYIVKPFSMRELMARIKTRLRLYHQLVDSRNKTEKISFIRSDLIEAGDLVLDIKRHEVRKNKLPLQLKPKEFDLLCYLIENSDRAVSRQRILEEVWGWDYIGDSRTVDVHVRWLRSKIEDDPSKPNKILTVPGVGYRFESQP